MLYKMGKYRTILFDLDGTLTDSKPGIVNSVIYALARLGVTEARPEKLTAFIGPPLAYSFQKYYSMDDKQSRRAVEYYREYFSVRGIYENRLYQGISELLTLLKNSGKRLIVATSKPTFFAERIVAYFKLTDYLEAVIGSDPDGGRGYKSEVIQAVLAVNKNLKSAETVMVGDREFDIIGAKNNGIDSVAVGYGYGSAAELQAAGPTYTVKSVSALRGLLMNC